MESWHVPAPPAVPGEGPPLRLHDTATGEVRPLAPGRAATMYVCGITPYDAAHLGHAMTYLTYDLVRRVLADAGHEVVYTQNVTDVDEPLFERAAETADDWAALGSRETEQFRHDMAALEVLPPTHFVGAVEAMPTIVEMIGLLRANGATYDLDGDTYFAVSSAPRFGTVGNLSYDEMVALSAERGGDPHRPGKKDPLDPVLWLRERPGEPSWHAPWGRGRPGWHVECSAIARATLGETMDLHGGGTDLVFPHHEMSSAEATAALGIWPFVRHWTHTAMVGLHGEKMSKSKGNLVFVRHLRLDHDGAAIRLALLAHHYRTPWEWTHDDIVTADARLARWREAVARDAGPDARPVAEAVRRHLADDLDAPAAVAAVDRWADAALRTGGTDAEAPAAVRAVAGGLLGVRL
ncbi:MAG TPA: cysteine--1-D-myo-inosityl 2-amino-2-deoxy-alpha-D-glucopyranoside ligase [Mycobacteriales bacterium]|jgi:L-cysteine:1D-myo-inositol 2-amino-2-deoxy-alpha-D-glucopyranoside ligase|nr:cysteine--1-D-myo-inosityl 2-amino-2-deoxy-alpha-D-glucopyranoside ligase [Mycobacteriales bacterium]